MNESDFAIAIIDAFTSLVASTVDLSTISIETLDKAVELIEKYHFPRTKDVAVVIASDITERGLEYVETAMKIAYEGNE